MPANRLGGIIVPLVVAHGSPLTIDAHLNTTLLSIGSAHQPDLTISTTWRQTDRHIDEQTNRQTDKQTNKQTERQTNREIGREIKLVNLFTRTVYMPYMYM